MASHLYNNLRIHQIFGANTDVGKTIFSTALALACSTIPRKASLARSLARDGVQTSSPIVEPEKVHYIKPVSTGPLHDADSSRMNIFAPTVDAHTLFQFNDPVSPHVAAQTYTKTQNTGNNDAMKAAVPSDELVRSRIAMKLSEFASASRTPSVAIVETAGGVHSPSPAGSSTADMLRPLRLPTVLIGDSNLGGISTTKSAYDSLIMAGYDVEALLLFCDGNRGLGNAEYLTKWGEEIGIKVWGLGGPAEDERGRVIWGPPPGRKGSLAEDQARMARFYTGLIAGRGQDAAKDECAFGVAPVVEHLRNRHQERIDDLRTMSSRTREHCWWPFTQHTLAKTDADVNVIESAHGDFFQVYKAPGASDGSFDDNLLQPLLDGSASWWTQCLGHANPFLTQAAARAAGQYGHILFPMCANKPALDLSEMLLGKQQQNTTTRAGAAPGAGWASRVFFSDDGSTGMEVAIKMALSSASHRYVPQATSTATNERTAPGRAPGYLGGRPSREWRVLGLSGSYHGDTIGAMDACEGSIYSDRVEWYKGRGDWLQPPTVAIKNGHVQVDLPIGNDAWKDIEASAATHSFDSVSNVYSVDMRLLHDDLAATYRKVIYKWLEHLTRVEGNRYGALIIEPLVMGAGGMVFVDPLFQRCLVDVVRENAELFDQIDPPLRRPTHSKKARETGDTWQGLPVIFDEVFTGLYRLGYMTPSDALGVRPDISVLAKILTGGMVPMSVTLASSSIFETFSRSEQKADALLHGHSYTAHPIGCEVAKEALYRIEKLKLSGAWVNEAQDWGLKGQEGLPVLGQGDGQGSKPWSMWSADTLVNLSHLDRVDSAMALGTVIALTLRDTSGKGGYASSASADLVASLRSAHQDGHPFDIHVRPLGNVIYVMCSLNTPAKVRRQTEETLLRLLS